MPDMDGLETVKRIRTLSKLHEEIPIVALTAHNKHVMEQKLVEYGLDGYIAKPIDKMSLLTEINRHLEPGISEEKPHGNQHSINDHRLSELIEDVGMEAVERLFEAFLIEAEQKLNNIEGYLNSEDFALLECESHALKSASLNFGLDQLSETMAEMEEAAIHKKLEVFKELARTACHQFELLPGRCKAVIIRYPIRAFSYRL